MKVGLLADVHGNADALRVVLESARRHSVQRLLCAGDCVGYYYEPDTCLDLLAEWDVEYVRGNHEDMLLRVVSQPRLADGLRTSYGSGLSVAASALSRASLAEMAALPTHRTITIDGKRIVLCHGTPWDTDTYVYPDAGDEIFRRCAQSGADYVVMGHTHYRFSEQCGSTRLLNPGSVGQPRDRKPGAAWGLLDTETGEYRQCSEAYDCGAVAERARAADPHLPYLWEVLSRR